MTKISRMRNYPYLTENSRGTQGRTVNFADGETERCKVLCNKERR